MKMNSSIIKLEGMELKITPCEDGLIAITCAVETESGYGKPNLIDIVIDTKNCCVVTGKMTDMLLYCLKGRRGENDNG